jgi:WhiB family redox-sensing transcriptional regulator
MRECAADALDNEMEFGVWGGMTERERRRLVKKTPASCLGRIFSVDEFSTR